MIKLICDLNISLRGHNAGHVQYIVDHIKPGENEHIYFLFNKNAETIVNISNSAIDASNFKFCESDFSDISLTDKFKFKEWRVIEQYATQLNIDELFIMELTHYEVQIGMNKVRYKISGIEFRPSHRIKAANGKWATRLSAKIQRYKRRFFETIMLQSKSLKTIFIFNDAAGAALLNKTYCTDVFKYLPDPIYDYSELNDKAKASLPHINKDKVIFIIFGSLDQRKNFHNIFKAFSLLDKNTHENICLLVIGKIPGYFEENFGILVTTFTDNNPDIELIVVDNFVTDSQMEFFFSITDISLVIYSKFYGSSGLLGRAAKYNAVSLVPNVGLMAELCTDYKLGYLCDPLSPDDIKDKINTAYYDIQDGKRIDGSEFYKNHSPQRFLQLLDF